MNKKLTIVCLLLFGFSCVFAQKDKEPTKLTRTSNDMNDVELLDKNFNIRNVSMDRVFYIEYKNDSMTMKEIDPNSPTVSSQENQNSGIQQASKPVQKVAAPTPRASSSSTRSGNYPTAKKSKKIKYKRIRLKKRKRVPQRRKRKCYRF